MVPSSMQAYQLTISFFLAHETTVLDWVRCLVREACDSVELEELGISIHSSASTLQPNQLCTTVLRIWAIVFSGNTMWAIINQIGTALRKLAKRLETNN